MTHSPHLTRRAWTVLSLVILLIPLLTPPVASGQTASAQTVKKTPSGEGPWVVRAYYADRLMVNDLAAWHEPWEVHHDQGYLVIDVTPAQNRRLLEAGFRLEIDPGLTAQLNQPPIEPPGQPDGIPGYPCYRTVEETFATAQAIVAAHPDLAAWTDVGDSWEKTANPANGYDMMVLRLTNSAIAGPKPKLFIMTSVHAREYATAELNTRFAEYLVDRYGLDSDVTWLLDYHEMHLLLQANPDGRKKAEGGALWRKNTNENYCLSNPNSRGADLNRNFEFQWSCCGGSSDSECSGTYHGPSPASEPETQAIQDYVRAQFPDQREDDLQAAAPITATGVFMDIHSYSELVLWPWGFTSTPAPNGAALQTLGRKLAYFNHYEPQQAMDLYPTDGTTIGFAYGELGLAAYVFELGTSFFQDCSAFENTILPDNLPALIYAAKVARAPYLTPAGPDALDVAVSSPRIAPGEVVTLTATLDDTRYHNNDDGPTQNVVAAEYYIDAPPWVTTTTPISYPMTAIDGAFGEGVEAVEAAIDSTGLSAGRHTMFVQAQDADGNWGALGSAFLYVLEPGVSPTIEGYVYEIGVNTPLSAVVTAGAFQTNTHPATGYYSMTVVSDTYDLSAVADGYGDSTVTGIQAHDYQTVRQDLNLYYTCEILADDVESGNQGWTAERNWAITTESHSSPSHSWTDSPGGKYGAEWNDSLTSPVLDLSDHRGITLSFWHTYDLEHDYDHAYVEYSTGADDWNLVAVYNGQDRTTWTRQEFPLPALDDQANARIRFRLSTDTLIARDGWHIDDIALQGNGPACIAPMAEFTSNSPVVLGNPLVLSNLSTGGEPLSYLWDFGDGLGASTERDPSYVYTSTGALTVTLTASNSRGSDSVSHPVNLLPPIYDVALTPATPAQSGDWGETVTHTLTITNQGNSTDRYVLETNGNTWTTTLSTTSTDELLPQESVSVQVMVETPLAASPGTATTHSPADTVNVTVTSVGDPGKSASQVLTTTARWSKCYLPLITLSATGF